MNRHLTVSKPIFRIATLLISLTALVLVADIASAALSCNGCHGNPPTDGSRTSGTGSSSFTGNHNQHVFGATNSTTALNVCSTCHSAAATSYTAAHSYYSSVSLSVPKVRMASKLGGYSSAHGRARYGKGTFNSTQQALFLNQTSLPVMSTCSNVDCHFERRTPTWGSTAFVANNDCNKCHGVPPAGVSGGTSLTNYTGGAAGSHAKHDLYYTGVTNGCVKCHTDHTADANKFAHATSGRTGHSLVVALKDPANVSESGSYGRATTYPSYYPSAASTTIASYATCTNIYCHSRGQSSTVGAYTGGNAPLNTTYKWGDSLGCASCHGDSTAPATLTAKHATHVGGGANYSYNCKKCHDLTVSSNTAIGNRSKHVDKSVTISFSNISGAINGMYMGIGATTPNSQGRTPGALPATAFCNNTYCHSQGRSATDYAGAAFKTMSTPHWNQTLLTGNRKCSACHGGDSANNSIQRQITSLAHRQHMGGFASGNYNFGCADCHSLTATDNVTINDKTKHANFRKNVDISATYGGTYTGNNTAPGSAAGTCGNVYCHSAGRTSGNTFVAAQAWNNTDINCTACHGNATTNGGAGVSLSAPHAAHVNNAAVLGTGQALATIACVDCHAKTISNDTTVSNRTLHVNKLVDYSGVRAGKSSTYSTATGCSASYCHSSGKKGVAGVTEPTTPIWNSTTLGCGGCHGTTGSFGAPTYASAGGNVAGSNSHALTGHVSAATDCIQCHRKTVNSTGTALRSYSSLHLDKAISVNLATGTWNAGKTCSSTVCHGSTSPAWGANTTNDACTKCHGTGTATLTNATYNLAAPPTAVGGATGTVTNNVNNNVKIGAHQAHLQYLNGYSNYSSSDKRFMCRNCHGTTLPSSSAHANGSSTPSFALLANNRGNRVGVTWTASSVTCSNTYCHNPAGTGGTLTAGNEGTRTFVSWTSSTYLPNGAKTTANCNRCHKSPGDSAGAIVVAGTDHNSLTIASDCAGCHGHNGGAGGPVGQRHMDGIRYGGGGTSCDGCHDYDTVGSTWGTVKNTNYAGYAGVNESVGAHAKHINYLKTRWSVSLNPTADFALGFGAANSPQAKVCGTCHTNTLAQHMNSTSRSINFGDGLSTVNGVPMTLGSSPAAVYNGQVGTSSATAGKEKTCSNLSCHYFTTPLWSTY